MSILGYSSAYFLPEYWVNTPLYGEKIIPLLDYILSTDYIESDKLANAFYNIENKYKNTGDLPIAQIEAIIDESGYSYVKDLLGNDEESIRLLVYLLVLIHQLKGTGVGIQVVLNLLRKEANVMTLEIVGDPTISESKEVSDFTASDYVQYLGLTTDEETFDLTFQVRTENFATEQCIASVLGKKLYLGIGIDGKLILSLGNNGNSWNIVDRKTSSNSLAVNTNYTINLSYSGYGYELTVSMDGKKFSNYLSVPSNEPIKAHNSTICIGVFNSDNTTSLPFRGSINLAPFSVSVDDITMQEWFEQTPVGPENTFLIKAGLDINLVSSDFFSNFARFVRKYVYPSLQAFEAKIALNTQFTVLPYVRQKVRYIASIDLTTFSSFRVKNEVTPDVWDLYYTTPEIGGEEELEFSTIQEVQEVD